MTSQPEDQNVDAGELLAEATEQHALSRTEADEMFRAAWAARSAPADQEASQPPVDLTARRGWFGPRLLSAAAAILVLGIAGWLANELVFQGEEEPYSGIKSVSGARPAVSLTPVLGAIEDGENRVVGQMTPDHAVGPDDRVLLRFELDRPMSLSLFVSTGDGELEELWRGEGARSGEVARDGQALALDADGYGRFELVLVAGDSIPAAAPRSLDQHDLEEWCEACGFDRVSLREAQ